MSLKAFHIIFITLSTLLAFGFAGWCSLMFFYGGRSILMLVLAILSLGGAVGLVCYGRYVLKKLKDISYL